MSGKQLSSVVALVAGWWLAVSCSALGGERPSGKLLDKIGVSRGICLLVGDKECARAIELARASELTCYVELADAKDVAAAAKAADAAGLYGTRVFVAKGSPARIGLADNLADAVVLITEPRGEEIERVLRPDGRVVSMLLVDGREAFVAREPKPAPAGVDDWSHHYHGPDNNPQSRDRVAKFPYLTQFIAEPRYAPAPQCVVASAGRVFMAFGHVAWHQREEAMLNTLVAVNGYNGTALWKRPLVPGIMVDRSTMIATPEALYLADDKSCKRLDAATGKLVDEIALPAELTGGTFWKWMALDGGVLYALIGADERQDPDARWGSTNHGWPWDRISNGYNAPDYPWGFSKTLLAIDPATKQILWSHKEDAAIDGRSLCLADGRIYFAHFGRYVACLDAKTGRPIWRRTAEKDPEVFAAIGPYRPGHGYVGGWKSTVYLKCTDKALYVLGPQVEWLTALSADDGHVLFKHPAKDLHIVIRDDGLYAIGPQGSKGVLTKKLDPLTGRVLAEYEVERRACTRSTGSCDAIFFRGHEGSGRLDLTSGRVQWISAMRPSCHVGVVIANGQLYWIPWTCDCNLQMFGMISLGPAGDFDFAQKASEAGRLEKVGDAAPVADFPRSPQDWPTFQADSARTARTGAAVPKRVSLRWKWAAKTPAEPTAPVAAGGVVFVSGLDGIVHALDAASGKVKWTAYTGGQVRYPPTIAAGRALVGSGDGWVYAFEAATGRLLWRFRAAPVERRIPLYGSLMSTWPVASGVLVSDGTAYFAAGIMDVDGTHVYALDAATGRIRWENNTSGHLDAWSRRGVTCQGEMLLASGKLYLAGGNTVSPAAFDAKSGACLNPPPGGMGSSAPRGRELRLAGGNVQVTGQPLYSLPNTPVFDPSVRWSDAVIATKNAELAVRPSRESSRPGWWLVAQEPAAGKPLWRQPLADEPVRWGIAVDAEGRVVVALRNGQVLCFGRLP